MPALRITRRMKSGDVQTYQNRVTAFSGERAAVTSTDLSLRAMLIWKKTLPDQFVGVTGFAFGILFPHSFQCSQRAIASGVDCADCAGNVCQPWRRRFFFELFWCSLPRPI